MTRLVLVRHGESEWNASGRVQGQSPLAGGLTPGGRGQALATAEELRRAGIVPPFIATSDLARALETAEIIAAAFGVGVETDPSLREQDLGRYEGLALTDELGDGTVAARLQSFWRTPTLVPEGGESVGALQARVRDAVVRFAARFGPHDGVVVTHGGPVRVLRALEDPGLLAVGRDLEVANGSLTELAVEADAVRLLSL